MKLLVQSALVTVVVLGLATGLFAFQRVADWGQINPQGQEKAEFAWSRLAYNTAMGGGGYGGDLYDVAYAKAMLQAALVLEKVN